MSHGPMGPTQRLTLGREAASKIDAAGADVAFLRVDDRVLITLEADLSRSLDSGRSPTNEVHDSFPLAPGLGAAEKAVVTFGD